jgi:uncharacterized repeat protein (TIGR01451 family)
MARSAATIVRRLVGAALLALVALAVAPVAASAAQPATLRLLDTAPGYRSVTVHSADGRTVTGSPGMFLLRATVGGVSAERNGFCVDLWHGIAEGRDYEVSATTAADDPRLGTARYAEAGWLIQRAGALIAAQPPEAREREAGALQVAIWQLVGEVRESGPTSDAALNARVAALRALAAGRRVGGPVTVSPEMPRACAGRGAVRVLLTGTPGTTAAVSVTSGPGVLSAPEVTFSGAGVATVTLTSATPGAATVSATSAGGALTRYVRARAGQTTPQETMVLAPATHTASATVVFEDCPLIPLDDRGPADTPTRPSEAPSTPGGSPVTPFEAPSSAPTTPAESAPHRPTQSGSSLRLDKTGPARVAAGRIAVYRIRITNRGGSVARGATVADVLPEGMSLVQRPSGARLSGGRLVWSLAPLPPGATRTLSVRVRMDADIAGRRCNRATLTLAGSPVRTARSCTRVVGVPRALLPAVTS